MTTNVGQIPEIPKSSREWPGELLLWHWTVVQEKENSAKPRSEESPQKNSQQQKPHVPSSLTGGPSWKKKFLNVDSSNSHKQQIRLISSWSEVDASSSLLRSDSFLNGRSVQSAGHTVY
jgi:hypothetical protein